MWEIIFGQHPEFISRISAKNILDSVDMVVAEVMRQCQLGVDHTNDIANIKVDIQDRIRQHDEWFENQGEQNGKNFEMFQEI